MRTLFVDVETYYDAEYSLRRMTPVEYILDPRFECIGWGVASENSPPVWLSPDQFKQLLAKLPRDVALVSHNALFDMAVLAWRFNYVPSLMIDTLSMSRAMIAHVCKSMSLDAVAQHLGLGVKGKTILKATGLNAEALKAAGIYAEYASYCCNDVELCRSIYKKLMELGFPVSEILVMDTVLRCAVKPKFQINQTLLAEHLAEVRANKEALLARCGMQSRDDLMSNEKFAEVLRKLGVTPPMKTSMATGNQIYAFSKQDDGMQALVEHDDPDVQALAAARLGVKSTQEETRTQKFINIARLQWPDDAEGGWMPIPLKFSGAHTHRLSGDWGMNLQNLPRGGKLRRALMAPDGRVVVVADASQIEARMNAWFCGEWELVAAFERGEDVYCQFASIMFDRTITKADKMERWLGKTCLAEGTPVVTDKGLVPIEQVTAAHRLWDGEAWVSHRGLVPKGRRETLNLCGIWLTPDHRVLCGTQWREAQYLAHDASFRSQALATGAASWSSPATSGELVGAYPHYSLLAELTPQISEKSKTLKHASKNLRRSSEVYDLADAGPHHRFTVMTDAGPLIAHNCILGLGYGMGWAKFQATVRAQSRIQLGELIDLSDIDATKNVDLYRATYPNIAKMWKLLNYTVLPGMTRRDFHYTIGPITFTFEKITGPNGLSLYYHNLRQEDGEWKFTYGRFTKRIYGAKMLENIIQFLSRICTMDAAVRVRRRLAKLGDDSLDLALQVHDELGFVPESEVAGIVRATLLEEMVRRPTWAPELPLAAESEIGPNYGEAK